MNEPPFTTPLQGPPPQGGPQGQWSPRSSSFFDSIRRSGWFRADKRIIGGVCSGIAAKTGLDLVLVRGIALVLIFFSWPLLCVYGALWALLPEQRDGRIHTEELLAGRLDAAQLGAGLVILLGFSAIIPTSLGFSLSEPLGLVGILFFLVALIVGIVCVIVVTGRSSRSGPMSSHTPPMSSSYDTSAPSGAFQEWRTQGGPSWEGAQATPPPDWRTQGGPSPSSSSGAAANTTGPHPLNHSPYATGPMMAGPEMTSPESAQQPYNAHTFWTPPVIVPTPRVSRRTNLLISGLILIIMATTFGWMYWASESTTLDEAVRGVVAIKIGLVGGGICLVIAGIGLAVASLHAKNAGWLIALSIIGCFLAIPTILVGISFTSSQHVSGSPIVSVQPLQFDWSDAIVYGNYFGNAHLDLTQAPSHYSGEILVDGSTLDLTLVARDDQPVRIVCSSGIDNVMASYTGDGERHWVESLSQCDGTESTSLSTHSDTWTRQKGITIRVGSWLTSLSYTEDSTATPLDVSTGDSQGTVQSGALSSPGAPQSGGSSDATTAPQSGRGPRASAKAFPDCDTHEMAVASRVSHLFILPALITDRSAA